MTDLVTLVEDAVRRHRMLPEDDAVVLAVSGGPDSMALLECMTLIAGEQAPRRLLVAHLDHCLRETSRADAEFTGRQAAERGLRFIIGREDVGAFSRRDGLSLEDAARRARHAFLNRTAVDLGAKAVAFGHNADDQAETVLMRICRGTGLGGLAGMRPVRRAGADAPGVTYVRPLLGASRAQIEAFVRERGLPFRTDETNAETRFRRNRVRHEVMPLIREALQPRAAEALVRLAELAAEAADHIDGEARELVGPVRPGEAFAIARPTWESWPPAVRGPALRLAFEALAGGRRLARVHVADVRRLADASGGEVDLPGGWRLCVSPEGLAFIPPGDEPGEGPSGAWRAELAVPGRVELPGGRAMTAAVRARAPGEEPPRLSEPGCGPAREEWLDYDAVGRPRMLVVRSRTAGDEFVPLGAPGRRSVKRFLIDIKVPRAARAGASVVTAGDVGSILWVAPHRIDEHGRVMDRTREVLVLRLE